MILVVVVRVGKDALALSEEAIHNAGPPQQVIVSVLLEMGVSLRELAAVAEPADVDEVCCRLLQPGHPRVVHQGESRPALAQQLGEIGADPTPVAYLDGVPWPLGQFPQESVQDLHALDGEVRRELEEQGTEPVFEKLHGADEAFGLAAAITEVPLVGQLLRKLGGKEKALRCDFSPPLHGRTLGRTVEGRIYLDRSEVLGVLGKPASGRGTYRIHRPLPVRIGPSGGAEVQTFLRRSYLPDASLEKLDLA